MAQHAVQHAGPFIFLYACIYAVYRNGKRVFIAHLEHLVYNETMLTSCNILHRKGVFLSWNM